jgi:hypothetical protein
VKYAFGLAAVAFTVGVWAGVRFYRSPAPGLSPIEVGIALALAGNLLLGLLVWSRARPGSGDAAVMPVVVFSSASILVGILPPLLWPTEETIHIAGFIASAVAPIILLVVQIRRSRRTAQVG